MKRISGLAALIASAGFLAGAAHAVEPLQVAAIGDLSGKVMVYNGSNYTAAKAGMPLEAGHKVVTLKGARADVAFDQGCVTSLDENAVLAISGVDACATSIVSQAEAPLMYAQAIGAGGGGAGGAGAGGGAGTAGMSSLMAAAGGFGTVLGIGAVGTSTDNSSGNPASPQ